jgi:hypothetical protein
MGIEICCLNGKITGGYSVKKIKDWKEVKEVKTGDQSGAHIVVKYMAREEVEALKAKQKEEYEMPEFEDV